MSLGWSFEELAGIVAEDLPAGSYVNLGIGLPNLVSGFVDRRGELLYQGENGVLGIGPQSTVDDFIPDLIDAGKNPVTLVDGACFFSHADSFAMIRSGRIDVAVMGAYQVSCAGDLANWSTGEADAVPAVGGAMDLAYGARQVWAMCRHATKEGRPKIVEACSYPLTGRRCVSRIYTDLAVIDVMPEGLVVRRLAPGIDFDRLQSLTGCLLAAAGETTGACAQGARSLTGDTRRGERTRCGRTLWM